MLRCIHNTHIRLALGQTIIHKQRWIIFLSHWIDLVAFSKQLNADGLCGCHEPLCRILIACILFSSKKKTFPFEFNNSMIISKRAQSHNRNNFTRNYLWMSICLSYIQCWCVLSFEFFFSFAFVYFVVFIFHKKIGFLSIYEMKILNGCDVNWNFTFDLIKQ